jgi:ADP-heptose:LPS heptosyltransferase
MVQLARLGDLLQTVPAITAIAEADPAFVLDLLCPAPLAPIGRMLPGITTVLEWDGMAWRQQAQAAGAGLQPEHLCEADRQISLLSPQRYDRAYVLNQHPHALLAGALLACETIGPRWEGPLGGQLTPWAAYIREVAVTGKGRQVHLADAFCGLCGVQPSGHPAALRRSSCALPVGLEEIGRSEGLWVGLIVGAGDVDRLVPLDVWRQWIVRFLDRDPCGRVVLIGQERERGGQLLDALPPLMLGRLWDATGRTSLTELAEVMTRCHRVIGADTGPLHLAAALGISVVGWYFARARVHQTGPYGSGHLIWEAVETVENRPAGNRSIRPIRWPIEETVAALVEGRIDSCEGWTVWDSHCDRWGAYYTGASHSPVPPLEREACWRDMSPAV